MKELSIVSSGNSFGLIAQIWLRFSIALPGCKVSFPFTAVSMVHYLSILSKYVTGLEPPPVVQVFALKYPLWVFWWLFLELDISNSSRFVSGSPSLMLSSGVWVLLGFVEASYCCLSYRVLCCYSIFNLCFLAVSGSTSGVKQRSLSKLQDMFSTVLVFRLFSYLVGIDLVIV